MTWSPRKLQVHKDLVLILLLRIGADINLPASTPSLMIKGYPWIIRELAEVEVVEMEVEAEMGVEVVRSLLGVCDPPMNGPLRTLYVQCPRSLVKVSEMRLNSEILPHRRSLGPVFGTPILSMGRIPINSELSSSRASSTSRIASWHSSGITRRSII
jgi:hypothetical protein